MADQLALYNQVIERLVDPDRQNAVIDNFRLAVAAGRQGVQLVRALRQAGITFQQGWDIVNGVDQQLRQHQRQWSEMATSLANDLGGTIMQGWNEHAQEQRDRLGTTGQAVWGQRNPNINPGAITGQANPNNQIGQTAITSGATPVRDLATGGRSHHNPNSGMGDSAGPVEPVPEAAALRAGGGGGPNPVSKETPVSSYPSLTYGVQETHTTILPWVMWCGLALDKSATVPLQLKIRLNSIYDMIDNAITAGAADDTVFSGPGFVNRKVGFNGRTPYSGNGFPVVPTAGTGTTERAQWRDYWAQLYQYYTVIGCEYEVIMVNPIGNHDTLNANAALRVYGGDIICAEQIDTYSDTAAATGNVMPLTTLVEVMNYKNIKWHKIEANGVGNNFGNTTIIKGRYTPGSTKRNIVNDGDVKTWTAVTQQPTLKEFLTLNFWPHPLSSGTAFGLNIQVRLKYIVQWKDLVAQARYPNSLNATGVVSQDIRNADLAAQTLTDHARQRIP